MDIEHKYGVLIVFQFNHVRKKQRYNIWTMMMVPNWFLSQPEDLPLVYGFEKSMHIQVFFWLILVFIEWLHHLIELKLSIKLAESLTEIFVLRN